MGLRFRKSFKKERKTRSQANSQPINGAPILGIIIGAFIFLWSGSFLLSFLPIIIIPILITLGENMNVSKEHTYTENERIHSLKRQERAQQQLQITIIKPKKQVKEIPEKEEKLLSLLEVNKE